jgi:hypothetical protein
LQTLTHKAQWLHPPSLLRADGPHWIKVKNPNAPAVKREGEIGGDDKPGSSRVTSRGCSRCGARRRDTFLATWLNARMAQNTRLGAHWRSRRHFHGFLSSGFSAVNALPQLLSEDIAEQTLMTDAVEKDAVSR